MKRLISLILGFIMVCSITSAASGKFVLVIDAGHGGRDPGAVRGKIKEKDINLAVAKEFGALVKKNMPDVEVIYTRQTDVFVSLQGRAVKANKAKANLFISIHTNSTAAKNTTVSGADTYILGLHRSAENMEVAKRENSVIKLEDDYTTKYEGFDPDSPESYIIFEFMTNHHMDQSYQAASYIQKDFKTRAKRVDRGVKQGGLLVLRESAMPSMLIELGFINNSAEAKYLSSTAGQRAMGSAIYTGFKKYKEEFDKRSGIATVSKNTKPAEQNRTETIAASSPDKIVSSSTQRSDSDVEYRVQFLHSRYKIADGSSQFKGIVPNGVIEDKSGYRYTVGATTDMNEIVKVQKDVRKKFKDAFVIKVPASSQEDITTVEEENTVTQTKIPAGVVEYRIQFMYSPTKLPDNSPRFKGLQDVSYYQDKGYKYTTGSTTSYKEISKLYTEVKKKFKDAFIIRMKDGKRL